jgi:hypothetical protein
MRDREIEQMIGRACAATHRWSAAAGSPVFSTHELIPNCAPSDNRIASRVAPPDAQACCNASESFFAWLASTSGASLTAAGGFIAIPS